MGDLKFAARPPGPKDADGRDGRGDEAFVPVDMQPGGDEDGDRRRAEQEQQACEFFQSECE